MTPEASIPAVARFPRAFTLAEAVAALKRASEYWIVAPFNGRNWFTNGSILLACQEEAADSLWGPERRSRWLRGMEENLARSAAAECVPAILGPRAGIFGFGYFRRVDLSEGSPLWLNEIYSRCATLEGECSVSADASVGRVYFERAGEVVAVAMYLTERPGISEDRRLANLPEIPFLEDAVLFHECCPEDGVL